MSISHYDLNQLRARGFRLTPQRLSILRVVAGAGSHLTPSEVYQQVHADLPGMTEATVYRTLNFLVEQGLVLVAHVGHGQLVYEIAGHDHHHLICRTCGEMREVDPIELFAFFENLTNRTGFRVDTMHATFFGYCPTCQGSE